jgi:hypothetical protein
MANLTNLEKEMLNKIMTDCFQDGREGQELVGNAIWAEGVAETKAEGGTLSSLIQKGYVQFDDYGNKRENLLSLTQEGLDAYTAE